MRKALVFAAVGLCLAAAAAGCGSGGRDVSSPSMALLGHWKNVIPGGDAEVYFSPDNVVYAGGEREPLEMPYEVLSQDQGSFTMVVRFLTAEGEGSKVAFSTDGKQMFLFPADIPEMLKYTYVDSKQAP